ncbi:MAG: tetratricopeptide repeat protein [Epsilonproteobacteria bacterium]|nr:tetratricopeptide repeat protein [Campylobacterota bacterium]
MKKLIILLLAVFAFASVKECYLRSYNYEKIGDYKDAIKVLIPLYKKYPNGYTLNLRLGYLFFLDGKYANAIKFYKQASLILPYSFEPKLGMMRVYLKIGEFKKVVDIGYSLIKVNYYDYYANLYTLQALKALKKYKDAIAIAKKMLAIYPTNVVYLVNLARIYEITNPTIAKKIYKDSVLILDPNNVSAKMFLK